MCSRTAFTKPILPRNEMKTATPPNGVTARCVSRRINRSSDNRAVISRGTGLSIAFDSISLLSQIPGPNLTPNFGFPDIAGLLAHLPDNLLGIRDRALLLVGFAGAFRRSELVALDLQDLEFSSEGLKVLIRRSKTD